jgi:hypothetical protein
MTDAWFTPGISVPELAPGSHSQVRLVSDIDNPCVFHPTRLVGVGKAANRVGEC